MFWFHYSFSHEDSKYASIKSIKNTIIILIKNLEFGNAPLLLIGPLH